MPGIRENFGCRNLSYADVSRRERKTVFAIDRLEIASVSLKENTRFCDAS